MQQSRDRAESIARNGGKRHPKETFVWQVLGPTNANDFSVFCKLDVAASKMVTCIEGARRKAVENKAQMAA